MLRQDLLNVLTSVKDALGGKQSMVPVHPCICATGTHVFTFDDTAALVAKLATPWKGAVRGEVLIEWLKACGGKEVEMVLEDHVLKTKCGRATSSLPVLDPDEFLFDPPDLSKAPKLKLTADVMGALRRASLAMGRDGQHPWRCGVQMILVEKEVTFFACDDGSAAMSFAAADVPKALIGKTPLLPPRFVDLVLKTAGEGELWISEDWFAASVDTGVTLFSAVPTSKDVKTFQQMFSDSSTGRKASVPLPKTWWGALKRASVVLAGEKEAPAVCKIEDGRMTLNSLSGYGSGGDTFKLEAPHRDFECRVPPAIALRPGAGEGKLVTRFCLADGPKLQLFDEKGEFTMYVASGS